jgi:hypothetical protein
MVLNDAQKAAICCLYVGVGAGRRGTGFLIAPNRVLTAAHVVEGDTPTVPYAGPIDVRFGSRPAGHAFPPTTARVLPGCFDRTLDWAVLECAAPAEAIPFPARVLGQGYRREWATFGFSDASPADGLTYDGTISSGGKDIQVHAVQAVGGPVDGRVRGLSGAPCLVDNHVVGVLVSAADQDQHGRAEGGTLFVVGIDRIAAACDLVKLPPTAPHFKDEVAALLEAASSLLPKAAEKLGVPHPKTISLDALRELVAERMLAGGIDSTMVGLGEIPLRLAKADANTILWLAASLWIDEAAARQLHRAVWVDVARDDAHRVPLIVNATGGDTGARYVHRGGCVDATHPGLATNCAIASAVRGENQRAGLADDVRDAIAEALFCGAEDIDSELETHDHATSPIVIVIPPPITPSAFAEVTAKYPEVQFTLLVGPEVTDAVRRAYPRAVVIEPPLAPGRESERQRAFQAAQKKLEQRYQCLSPRQVPR